MAPGAVSVFGREDVGGGPGGLRNPGISRQKNGDAFSEGETEGVSKAEKGQGLSRSHRSFGAHQAIAGFEGEGNRFY